jgi:hypothetical protein
MRGGSRDHRETGGYHGSNGPEIVAPGASLRVFSMADPRSQEIFTLRADGTKETPEQTVAKHERAKMR